MITYLSLLSCALLNLHFRNYSRRETNILNFEKPFRLEAEQESHSGDHNGITSKFLGISR